MGPRELACNFPDWLLTWPIGVQRWAQVIYGSLGETHSEGDTLRGSAATGLQSQLRPSPCTSFIYMPCMLIGRHPSHSHGWTLGLNARPGEMACRCSEVKCRHSWDESRCMIPEPPRSKRCILVRDEATQMFLHEERPPSFPIPREL